MTNPRNPAQSRILGLHHVTLVASNAQRTADFYTGVLGLRLVKTTVNFDDRGSYHLYFADETGSAGTVITFFEWTRAPRGRPDIGGTHHVALRVRDRDGLLKWKRRLTDLGLKVIGPYDRHCFTSIYFRDPDGVILEIATDGPGMLVDEGGLAEEQRTPPSELVRGARDEAAIAAITWPEPVGHIDAGMSLLGDPDGHIVELATMGPGFLIDEPVETTGSTLRLPPWREAHRQEIAASLDDFGGPWPNDGSNADLGVLSHPRAGLPAADETVGAV
jgi:catechol 2,3-dioxygenase-like lactoylglutathione lyase family enzyme